jgi:hypothetical protein
MVRLDRRAAVVRRHGPSRVNLPFDFALSDGPLSRLARSFGWRTVGEVAEAIRALPYGRVSDPEDVAAVLRERKGTCSSKHRFLAALAHECGRTEVKLMLGLYEMSEDNTPGTGAALGTLGAIPEVHCYLAVGTERFDFTGLAAGAASPFDSLLEERAVSPADLPATKPAWHRRAMDSWARARNLDPDAAWEIRERCIAALAGR